MLCLCVLQILPSRGARYFPVQSHRGLTDGHFLPAASFSNCSEKFIYYACEPMILEVGLVCNDTTFVFVFKKLYSGIMNRRNTPPVILNEETAMITR